MTGAQHRRAIITENQTAIRGKHNTARSDQAFERDDIVVNRGSLHDEGVEWREAIWLRLRIQDLAAFIDGDAWAFGGYSKSSRYSFSPSFSPRL